MDEILGHPTVDPHGSPIPDKNGKISWKSYQKVRDCKQGNSVKLAALTHSSEEFLKYLNSKKLSLGITLLVQFVEKFDGSVTIRYHKNQTETLSAVVCEKLLVESMDN